MEANILHIKNMVCPRCLWAVEGILNKLGIGYEKVSMGQIVTALPKDKIKKMQELKMALLELGFEMLEERQRQIVEQIKGWIFYWIKNSDAEKEKLNLSTFLALKLGRDYSLLSMVFSELEGTTIEKFLIHQRIERAKMLILYDELNFAEISYELGYSSPSHFSNQFKLHTGFSPHQFKRMKQGSVDSKIM